VLLPSFKPFAPPTGSPAPPAQRPCLPTVQAALRIPPALATPANNCTVKNVPNAFRGNTKTKKHTRPQPAKIAVTVPFPTRRLKVANQNAHPVPQKETTKPAIRAQQEHTEAKEIPNAPIVLHQHFQLRAKPSAITPPTPVLLERTHSMPTMLVRDAPPVCIQKYPFHPWLGVWANVPQARIPMKKD
jgi:hypothetical protein